MNKQVLKKTSKDMFDVFYILGFVIIQTALTALIMFTSFYITKNIIISISITSLLWFLAMFLYFYIQNKYE